MGFLVCLQAPLVNCGKFVPGHQILKPYFFAGAKVHQSQKCTRIIEPGGVSYTLESVGGIEGATHDMKPLLEHAQNLYKQCVHLERVMNKEESNSNGGQYFPFIVCRKPPPTRKPPKGSDVETEAPNSRYRYIVCNSLNHRQSVLNLSAGSNKIVFIDNG